MSYECSGSAVSKAKVSKMLTAHIRVQPMGRFYSVLHACVDMVYWRYSPVVLQGDLDAARGSHLRQRA